MKFLGSLLCDFCMQEVKDTSKVGKLTFVTPTHTYSWLDICPDCTPHILSALRIEGRRLTEERRRSEDAAEQL
jgi:hypothetical protein